MKLCIFFSGQNKTDMKASLVKLGTSVMGNMFCDTSKEWRSWQGGKPKRSIEGRKEVVASCEKGKQLQKNEEGC